MGRTLNWLGYERAVGYSKMLALAFIFPLVWFYVQAMGPIGADFIAFWTAAKLTLSGAAPYDSSAQLALQKSLGVKEFFPFVNPPPFLLLVLPLGILPYPVALPVWVAATYAAWLAVTRRFAPSLTWPIAVFPGAMVGAWQGQNGLFTATLFAGAVSLLRSHPFAAGLLFGALIIKPHLGLLVPVALLAGREWWAMAGAAVSSVGLFLLSLLAFGPDAVAGFLQITQISAGVLSNDTLLLRMPTIYAATMVAFGSQPLALATQTVVGLFMAAIVWRAWRSEDALYRGSVLVLATVLSTPYLYHYDLVFLVLPIVWLAREAMVHGWRPWEKAGLVLLYWLPLLSLALSIRVGANPAWPFTALALWMVISRRSFGPSQVR